MKGTRRGPAALLLAGAVAAALLAGGCGETDLTGSSSAVYDDDEALREFVETEGLSGVAGPYDGEQLNVGDDGATRDEIDPLSFWRVIDDKIWTHECVVDMDAGTAECTSTVEIFGTLNILDESMVEYVKPMHHTGVRHAEFVRDETWTPQNGGGNGGAGGDTSGNGGADGDGQAGAGTAGAQVRRGPWALTAVSGFRAQSDTLTMAIEWVRYQGATVDVTVTDPLELLAVPDEIMAFAVGEQVTVTVAGPPEGSILFLHAAARRIPLQCQPDYTFAGAWTVRQRGRHNAWVEAIAHDSIFDSLYPDDTLIWGTPYRVIEE